MEKFDQIDFQTWMKGDPVSWLRATKRDAPTVNKLRPAFLPTALTTAITFFCIVFNDITYIRYIALFSFTLNASVILWSLLKIHFRAIYPVEKFIIKNIDEYESPESIFLKLNQLSNCSEIHENEKLIANIILGKFKTNLH